MKFCPACGIRLEPEVRQCPDCGAPTDSRAQKETAPPSPWRYLFVPLKLLLGFTPDIAFWPYVFVCQYLAMQKWIPLMSTPRQTMRYVYVYYGLSFVVLLFWANWITRRRFGHGRPRPIVRGIAVILLAIGIFFVNLFLFFAGCALLMPNLSRPL